jgi:F-type H+-transporting ATPase subunit gamma
VAEKLSDLRERIGSVRQLRELVGAMRSLAAARLHQAEATLPAVREYAAVSAAALADALALMPVAPAPATAPIAPTVVIAVCAEHGFVGAFSARVLAGAAAAQGIELLVVGSHGLAAARDDGLQVAWSRATATQLGAIARTAHAIVEQLYQRIAAGSCGAVDVVFTARRGIVRRALLPVDSTTVPPRRRPCPPLTHLTPARLVERILEEYVLAEMVQALVESFAAENATRLQTMQAAHQHVDETLGDLEIRERRARQEQITHELLELATGAAALEPPERR